MEPVPRTIARVSNNQAGQQPGGTEPNGVSGLTGANRTITRVVGGASDEPLRGPSEARSHRTGRRAHKGSIRWRCLKGLWIARSRTRAGRWALVPAPSPDRRSRRTPPELSAQVVLGVAVPVHHRLRRRSRRGPAPSGALTQPSLAWMGSDTSSSCIGEGSGLSSKRSVLGAATAMWSDAAVLSALLHECAFQDLPAAAAMPMTAQVPVMPSALPGSTMMTSTAPEVDERPEVRLVPALLAGADARPDRRVQPPVSLDVLLGQRVLEPVQAHRVVDRAAHPDGMRGVPAGECDDVDDHLRVRADRLADRPRHGQVAGRVQAEGDGQVVSPAALDVSVALRPRSPRNSRPIRSRSPVAKMVEAHAGTRSRRLPPRS